MRVSFDSSEVDGLRDACRRLPAEVTTLNRATVTKEIKAITRGWQSKARVSAGDHGKLYPLAIRDESVGPLEAVTGPISALPQGGMGPGFEWGHPTVIANPNPGWWIGPDGEWRPGGFAGQRVGQDAPHLDMTKTVDEREPLIVRAVSEDVREALAGW